VKSSIKPFYRLLKEEREEMLENGKKKFAAIE
jgi:hypothetical protein